MSTRETDGTEDGMEGMEEAIEGQESNDLSLVLRAGGGGGAGSMVARLRACAQRLVKPHQFQPGQLVQWKKGLKNKRTPEYGEPVVVVQVLAEAVYEQKETSAGSPYFREPLTLVAGEVDKDGDFLCFHYDARRFEPYAVEADTKD